MKKGFAVLMTVMLCLNVMMACAENETIQVIMSTGTTQAFTDAAVSEADLNTIIQAGVSAVSAINQQPWFFVALTNQEIMAELGGGMGFGGTPAAIIIYMNENTASPDPSFDCGLACQNMQNDVGDDTEGDTFGDGICEAHCRDA